ncbi:MAG TPA: SH3 domain-containing protein [Anaerolineae bacterium]
MEAGEKEKALTLYVEATKADPTSEEAWWELAHATENPSEAVHALERVLEINPNNARAREELTFHQVTRWRTATTSEQAVAQGKTASPRRRVFLFALAGIAAVALIALGIYWLSANASFFAAAAPPTEPPTLAALLLPPTWTPTRPPTSTRTPTPTNTPQATATVEQIIGRVKDAANVRAGPGTVYAILGGLSRDKTLTLVGKSEDGRYFQFENPDRNSLGWVFADLVEITNGAVQALAVMPSPPYTPLPPRVIVAASTPVPAQAQQQFRVSKVQPAAPNCFRWNLKGTVWNQGGEGAGPGNTRPGVRLRIVANGVTTFVTSGSGSFARVSPGYWELVFGQANAAIEGNVTIVDPFGLPISPAVTFQLTASCAADGDVNEMTIDFDSIPF